MGIPDIRVDARPSLERLELILWLAHVGGEKVEGAACQLSHLVVGICIDWIVAFVILDGDEHPLFQGSLRQLTVLVDRVHGGFRQQDVDFTFHGVHGNLKVRRVRCKNRDGGFHGHQLVNGFSIRQSGVGGGGIQSVQHGIQSRVGLANTIVQPLLRSLDFVPGRSAQTKPGYFPAPFQVEQGERNHTERFVRTVAGAQRPTVHQNHTYRFVWSDELSLGIRPTVYSPTTRPFQSIYTLSSGSDTRPNHQHTHPGQL